MQIMLETVTWLRNVIAKPSKVTPNPLPEILDTPKEPYKNQMNKLVIIVYKISKNSC